ncbi:hypothetical protein [Mucilaginibacter sp.]|uniref:hypothetical protein n=1 Tax=Mucilaginibacter sp. TaxID=1882438 RepID=UPI002623E520|nr:hypothetical protein [Mucilaginibacter sp.]MDB4918502.1 hypothetical protein [Mucilaginibacter sp.]
MNKILTPKLKGFLVPNIFAIATIGTTKYTALTSSGILIFSEFIIVPILMGIISAWFWKDLELPGRKLSLYSIYNTFLAILFSFLFLSEGVICLLIVSPLIFGFLILGAFMGRTMFEKNNQKLNASIIVLLLFVFITDSLSTHHYENMVSDTIIVNATPDKVWKNVVAFKRIKQSDTYWLFRIGMPSPIESTVTGYYKGAGRKCIFSNGYVFDERIATYEPGVNLTFDVTHQPRDPEIMNHIDIIRGQFLLKDNGNGTTTLVGNSWYKLYVFPTWYYDIWAESITRNVHLRVMEHIKELSENN